MIDAVNPTQVVQNMIELAVAKTKLSFGELLVRSGLAGALLGVSTTLAFTAATQSGEPIVGAVIFPVGFAMIVVMGFDLVTGSFALMPMAVLAKRITFRQMLSNWAVTFLGNALGSLILVGLVYIAMTNAGHDTAGAIGEKFRATVTSRSAGYAALGLQGLMAAFAKAMLCNWLVCLGIVMSLTASTSAGKILGCWLPVVVFFAQGFEHTVVNMTLFPLGLLLGANATLAEFLLSNELPVTIGNLVGGFLFTGLALYFAYPKETAMKRAATRLEPATSAG